MILLIIAQFLICVKDPLSPNNFGIVQKLNKFAFLPANWDGYNADAPSQVAIKQARYFVYQFNQEEIQVYFTAPGPNGEVLLELKNDKKAVEIYFYEETESDYCLFEQNNPNRRREDKQRLKSNY